MSNNHRHLSAAAIEAGEGVVVRRAGAGDAAALDRLRQLEGRGLPAGPALLATVEGCVVAAVAVEAPGEAIADPFRPTASIVELLELRAAQLAGGSPQPSSWRITGRRAAAASSSRRTGVV